MKEKLYVKHRNLIITKVDTNIEKWIYKNIFSKIASTNV
jgi:hypothetical protein